CPTASATAGTTCSSEKALSTLPLGRPKWLIRIALPPCLMISRIVGTTRSMRVASVTLPSCTGTLRSARSSTRLFENSIPSIVLNALMTHVLRLGFEVRYRAPSRNDRERFDGTQARPHDRPSAPQSARPRDGRALVHRRSRRRRPRQRGARRAPLPPRLLRRLPARPRRQQCRGGVPWPEQAKRGGGDHHQLTESQLCEASEGERCACTTVAEKHVAARGTHVEPAAPAAV